MEGIAVIIAIVVVVWGVQFIGRRSGPRRRSGPPREPDSRSPLPTSTAQEGTDLGSAAERASPTFLGSVSGIVRDVGTMGAQSALLAFSDTLVFVGTQNKERRLQLESVIESAKTHPLSPQAVSDRLPDVAVLPTDAITSAVLTRSFRGVAYGTTKLWFKGTDDKTWSTWLVTKKARQPLRELLRAVLGARFEDRVDKTP